MRSREPEKHHQQCVLGERAGPNPESAPSKMAKTKRSTRLAVPTFAYWRPITDLTLARSTSSHPIDFSAGETTVVVKSIPPSYAPTKITCSVCTKITCSVCTIVFSSTSLTSLPSNLPYSWAPGTALKHLYAKTSGGRHPHATEERGTLMVPDLSRNSASRWSCLTRSRDRLSSARTASPRRSVPSAAGAQWPP